MGREPWKCSHADCKQESSRFWNLMRHIRRLHKGEGIPVKNKSDIRKTAQDRQFPEYIEGPYPRNSLATEENKKIQVVKTTSEPDFVDDVYQMYRKIRDRNDKMEEMTNYFASKRSNIPFPPKFDQEIFNHNKPENVLPFHIWSGFSSESITSAPVPSPSIPSTSSMTQVDNVQPKMVVGFVEYICNYCLEFEPLQVTYDPSASDRISWTRHACDPDILKSAMAYPPFFREDVYLHRILLSSKEMIKTVKEWTKGEVFLISNKLTSNEVPKCTITLDLRKNEYDWLTRAIDQKYTTLNDKELKDFFNLITERCATFCCLCINFVEVEGERDARQEFYLLFLSYKFCLPWENR
jgi:hypothetical protein